MTSFPVRVMLLLLVIWQMAIMCTRSPACNSANSISISSTLFQQLTAEGPYTLQWADPSPSKLPFHMGRSGPPSNTWFIGSAWVHYPKAPKSFSGFCRVCDRPTDEQTDTSRPTDRQHATPYV